MTFTVKHAFQSAKADGVDATVVRPSDWNDDHDIELSGPGVIGRTAAGAGAATHVPFSYFAVPAGAGMDFWGSVVPDGYLLAYGQAVSRTTYADLFAAIGVQYGSGDGSTTFNLPDKRGRVTAGKDDMGGSSAAQLSTVMSSTTLGATGGTQTNTTSTTVSGSTSGSLTVNVTGTQQGDFSALRGAQGTDGPLIAQNGATSTVVASGTTSGSISVSASGSSAAFSIVQPTIIANYIIKT